MVGRHCPAVLGVLELIVDQDLLGLIGLSVLIRDLEVLVVSEVVHHGRLLRVAGPGVLLHVLRRVLGWNDHLSISLLHDVAFAFILIRR